MLQGRLVADVPSALRGAGIATVVLVSPNVSPRMGGEAMKVLQFAQWLVRNGVDLRVVTHGRCRRDLVGQLPDGIVAFVEDDRVQVALWRSRVLGALLGPYFHHAAGRIVRALCPDAATTLVHYVCPISPLEPRLIPRGYRAVIGPLNGNIDYPPALRAARASRGERLHARVYAATTRLLAPFLARERRTARLLVSGGERTLTVLESAGAVRADMVEVLDSGVPDRLLDTVPTPAAGFNGRFLTCSRLVDWKAIDLAIRAAAECGPEITLDVVGEGECRPALEALAAGLGVGDRVRFRGWVDHATLFSEFPSYRGFVFPSLREANGIAMQEAMMAGLPVVALDWGGPAMLADAASAILIEPAGEEAIVGCLALAMTDLAVDPGRANRLAGAARARARRFAWDEVALSWVAAYPGVGVEAVPGLAPAAAAV